MDQQPGQPNKKKEGFNWKTLIISLFFMGGIVTFGWWAFFGFGSSTPVKGIEFLESRIKANAADEDDDNYFTKFNFNSNAYKISVTEKYINNDGNQATRSYDVGVPLDVIYRYANPTVITTNGVDQIAYGDIAKATQHTDYNIDNNIIKDVGPEKSSILSTLLITLLPTFLIILFFVWMYKKGGGIGDAMGTGKNEAKKIISKTKFSDIAGQEEVKDEVKEVVDFLKHPAKYKAAGARIPKGIMLGGPPGTGKTLIAKATAGEAGVPFYFISASNFVEMFAGLGAKRVRTMFREARKSAPSILFIDELDAIGRKRGSSLSGNDEREQTLNQILVEMDGMEENVGLLVMAATNRPDVLDPALMRPGRFDRSITVNNPNIMERKAILELHSKGKRISDEIDFLKVAKRTPGYSGAQLENIINEAALLSVREETGVVTLEQIDEAIDRVAAGPAKKGRIITKSELTMIAYHEAGHALIGMLVAEAEKVQKITIIPRGNAGGYTLMTPKEEKYNYSKTDLESKIVSYMGGRAAEQIIYGPGEVSTGASDDIVRATNIARAMVTQYGMSDLGPVAYEKDLGPQYLGQDQRAREYSDSLAQQIDEAVRKLINIAEKKAVETIKKNMPLLKLMADELLEKETIVAEEIEYIYKNRKRPPKRAVKKVNSTDTKSITKLIEEVEKEESE